MKNKEIGAMKKSVIAILVALMAITAVFSQTGDDAEKDRVAVKMAAMDYMEGAYEADASRELRAAHPEMHKVSLRTFPQTGKTALWKAGCTRLVEIVRGWDVSALEGKDKIKVKIFAVKEGLASVLVTSPIFYDHVLMAKIEDQWKLINVLWRRNSEDSPEDMSDESIVESDRAAIRQTALDYIEGYFSGDAERMERALHPELHKVLPVAHPKTGRMFIDKVGAGFIIEATRAKLGLLEEDKRNIEVTIFDINQDIAMIEVLSTMFYDYIQLAKIDGQWKIVNVLWKMNPDAPRPDR
jgi:hypothetical protein